MDPPKSHHDDFKIEIGVLNDDNWVCVGGGGTGHHDPGNYLTASFPSDDFKSWNVYSRDHIETDSFPLIGYAIGMKIEDLSKAELVENLHIFKDPGASEHHPDRSCTVNTEFSMLVGGGFQVLDQPSDTADPPQLGGNMATGSFPDSTISWRGNSKDHIHDSPSRISVYAIGIRPSIIRGDDSIFGNVVTMYHSYEKRIGQDFAESMVRPLPGMALCGGGAAAHWYKGMLLWALEPTTIEGPITPNDQSFTGKSKNGNNWFSYEDFESPDYSTVTAYAMGIKFDPSSRTTPPPLQCINPIEVNEVSSSGHQEGFPPDFAIDPNPNTKWVSTNIVDPSIRFALGGRKKVCRLDITWVKVREYHFNISVSTDGDHFTDVISNAIGILGPIKYSFPKVVKANFIKITITQFSPTSTTSEAQISEIKVFGP